MEFRNKKDYIIKAAKKPLISLHSSAAALFFTLAKERFFHDVTHIIQAIIFQSNHRKPSIKGHTGMCMHAKTTSRLWSMKSDRDFDVNQDIGFGHS